MARPADTLGPLTLGFKLSAAMDEIAKQYEKAGDATVGPGRMITIVEPGARTHFALRPATASENKLEVESFTLADHVVIQRDLWSGHGGWNGLTVEWVRDDQALPPDLRLVDDGFYASFDPANPVPLGEAPEALLRRA